MTVPEKTPEELPAIPYRRAPLVFLLLVACVLAITWPWATHFSTEFASHWDPPFHAWKLWYVADAILHGHILPPDGNTNMYYPNSCALYYEALHWPQAVFAAILLPVLRNPVLVYHVTLVAFWALAGVFVWMLLLALKTKESAALFGAVIFTILPYRTSYYVEFNMQLCFGLPLFLFFLVRYFQRPSIPYACGVAAAMILQASSELYQAVFLALISPFLLLPLLKGRWRLLLSRKRFLYPALAALGLSLVATYFLLLPYLSLLNNHTLMRTLEEIHKHRLETFSYLTSTLYCRWRLLPKVIARRDEMCVYPTLVVLLLTTVFLVRSFLCNLKPDKAWTWKDRILPVSRILRAGLLALFFAIALVNPSLDPGYSAFAHLFSLLPVAICFLSVVILILAPHRTISSRLMEGLFAGAVFSVFMSYGPNLRGPGDAFVGNPLYVWCHAHVPALHGFRVVSRFSVFPMIFMTLASAIVFSLFLERVRGHRGLFSLAWVPLALLVACESVPRLRPFREAKGIPLQSKAVRALEDSGVPFVLAPIPFGNRYTDSMDMLRLGGTTRMFVYAWGGTYPPYTRDLLLAEYRLFDDPGRLHRLLSEVWPECYPVITLNKDDEMISDFQHERGFFSHTPDSFATPFSRDDEYAVYKLLPLPAGTNFVKLVRRDFVRKNKEASLFVRPEHEAADIAVDLNGRRLGDFHVEGEGRALSVPYLPDETVPIRPNVFSISSRTPFTISDFKLQ